MLGAEAVTRILKPKRWVEKTDQVSLRLPKDLIAEVEKRAKENGLDRTEAILEYLTWALDEEEKSAAAHDSRKGKA